MTNKLECYGNHKSMNWLDVGQNRKNSVADETTRAWSHAWFINNDICTCQSSIYRGSLESIFKGQIATTLHLRSTLSAAVTSAQKFGAQYAWFNPRLKGKSRESNWGICPRRANGPKETTKTAITAFANERKFLIWISPAGERQNDRRRYTKYAGL